MRITAEMQDARLNVRETAALVGVHEAHFRRLVRRGIFPAPKRTQRGQPYYDHALLEQIASVVRGKVGANGQEVMFYSRRRRQRAGPRRVERQAASSDGYIRELLDGLEQLGIDRRDADAVQRILAEEYGTARPPLEQALPAVARRILGDA